MAASLLPRNPAALLLRESLPLYLLAIALFLILVGAPLIALAAALVQGVLTGTAAGTIPSLFTARRFILLFQTLGLGAAVAVAGTATGVLVATGVRHKPRSVSLAVLLLVLALIPIPPYIHALAWSSSAAAVNNLIVPLGAAPLPLTGWVISFWVQYMALLPIAILLCGIALAAVDPILVEAARIHRPDPGVFRRIVLPLAAPTLAAAAGFLFVLSSTDYSIPSLFGSDTYALDIFAYYSATGSTAGALICAAPLLLVTVLAMAFCRTGVRNLAQNPQWTSGLRGPPLDRGLVLQAAQEVSLALLAIQACVMVAGLFLAALPLSRLGTTLGFSSGEIGNSLVIAVITCGIGIPLAGCTALELLDNGWRGSFFWGIVLLPLAIPAPLIGIGLVAVWNSPPFSALYGTILMPVLASLVRFLPLAVIILFAQLRMTDPLLFDAARVFSRNAFFSLRSILFPLVLPGLLVASALLFALTLGELGATLIVAPPGAGTLAIRIYNYLHYGAAAEVAGLCLVMTLIVLAAGAAIASVIFLRGRPAPEGDGGILP